jgi:hypothetical protein
MYLRVGGQQKQLAGLKCQPLQGAGQGGQDLQDPDWAKGGDHLSG